MRTKNILNITFFIGLVFLSLCVSARESKSQSILSLPSFPNPF